MNRFAIPLIAITLATALSATVYVLAADTPAPATTPSAGTSTAIGVDALVANPKAHAGKIMITGVVARVFPKTGNFVLIDSKEYAACGSLTCAEVSLPIQTPIESFTGELPQLKDTVVVFAEVTPLEKGLTVTVVSVKKGDTVLRQRK